MKTGVLRTGGVVLQTQPSIILKSEPIVTAVQNGAVNIETLGGSTVTRPNVVGRGGGGYPRKTISSLFREHLVSIHRFTRVLVMFTLLCLAVLEVLKIIAGTTGVNFHRDRIGMLWASITFGFCTAIVGCFTAIKTYPILLNTTRLFLLLEFILEVAFFSIAIKKWYTIVLFIFNVILFAVILLELAYMQWKMFDDPLRPIAHRPLQNTRV